MKLGETVKSTSYTHPSPIKATPDIIASDSNDVSTASVSKASDVMMTSSDQRVQILKKRILHLIKTHQRAKPPP